VAEQQHMRVEEAEKGKEKALLEVNIMQSLHKGQGDILEAGSEGVREGIKEVEES